MRTKVIAAVVSLVLSALAFAQAENEIICKSISNPTNVKVFEGDACPFGWVKVEED